MKLEIRYKNGIVETYDTEKMTAASPGGGIAGMIKTVAIYSSDECSAPGAKGETLPAGLWVHLYQYNVDRALASNANMKAMMLVGRFGIINAEAMDGVHCVLRDGLFWLVRDWSTNTLMDVTNLSTFGSVFVENFGRSSLCVGLSDAIDVAESLGILIPGWTFADAADLFGLPESFVERVMNAGEIRFEGEDDGCE